MLFLSNTNLPFLHLIPVGIIVAQPDLGSAISILFLLIPIIIYNPKLFKISLIIGIIFLALSPLIYHQFLHDYQKNRIINFLNPTADPLGQGYNVIQSKIAIGSGMITGKGFLQGTQSALDFLPEQHTDFILSVLAEEWGFAGCLFLLFLYLVLLLWGLNISYSCRDMFGSILAFGVTLMIFLQIFINVAMVMGIMPVVGVPLPLISYGGSSVITNMVGIGILMNISMRRFASN